MNLREFRDRLIAADNKWQQERINIALTAGQDASALAIERVQNTGQSAVGGIFGIYAGLNEGVRVKDRSTARQKVLKGHTRTPYPSINFTDTGDMFRSTAPRLGRVTATTVEVIIEPADADRREVMAFHNERFENNKGKIVALNENEQQILQEDHLQGVIDFINENEL